MKNDNNIYKFIWESLFHLLNMVLRGILTNSVYGNLKVFRRIYVNEDAAEIMILFGADSSP